MFVKFPSEKRRVWWLQGALRCLAMDEVLFKLIAAENPPSHLLAYWTGMKPKVVAKAVPLLKTEAAGPDPAGSPAVSARGRKSSRARRSVTGRMSISGAVGFQEAVKDSVAVAVENVPNVVALEKLPTVPSLNLEGS